MPMKKATRERRVGDFLAGYKAGRADGERAAEVLQDSKQVARELFEGHLEDDANDVADDTNGGE